MFFIAISLSITDIILLQIMAIGLGFVVYFVVASRRSLQKMLDESKNENSVTATSHYNTSQHDVNPHKTETAPVQKTMQDHFFGRRKNQQKSFVAYEAAPTEESVSSLKENIRQQQKTLDVLLRKVDKWSEQEEDSTDYKGANKELKEEL